MWGGGWRVAGTSTCCTNEHLPQKQKKKLAQLENFVKVFFFGIFFDFELFFF